MPSRWYTLLALPFPDQHLGRRDLTARRGTDHPYSFGLSAAHRAGYFSNPSLQFLTTIAPYIYSQPPSPSTLHATTAHHYINNHHVPLQPPMRHPLVKVNEQGLIMSTDSDSSFTSSPIAASRMHRGHALLEVPKASPRESLVDDRAFGKCQTWNESDANNNHVLQFAVSICNMFHVAVR